MYKIVNYSISFRFISMPGICESHLGDQPQQLKTLQLLQEQHIQLQQQAQHQTSSQQQHQHRPEHHHHPQQQHQQQQQQQQVPEACIPPSPTIEDPREQRMLSKSLMMDDFERHFSRVLQKVSHSLVHSNSHAATNMHLLH